MRAPTSIWIALVVGFASNNLFSQTYDSIGVTIPTADTAVSLFAQSRLPISLSYQGSAAMNYLPTYYKVEIHAVSGAWIDIKNPYQIDDTPSGSIIGFPSSYELNLLYFFGIDSLTFNACISLGCQLDVRVSNVFQADSILPVWKTSNICKLTLPKADPSELEQFLFLSEYFQEEFEAISWFRHIDTKTEESFETALYNFNKTPVSDLIRYYVLLKKYGNLLGLNGNVINDEVRTSLVNEFGDLQNSENLFVASSSKDFFYFLTLKH